MEIERNCILENNENNEGITPSTRLNRNLMIQSYENSIMKEVEMKLSEPNCQNGCILINFPQSPKQYSFLTKLNSAEHIPIFFEIDNHVRPPSPPLFPSYFY